MRYSLLGLAAAVGVANGQIATYCAAGQTGICYSVNIPTTSVQSGSGPIYVQITAPSSKEWVAVGQGSQMAGANIMIIYADESGTNVTLSPRLGLGQFMPNYNSAAQVTLLAGSGISNGIMTANVRCDSCQTWSGGSMSYTDSNSNWIWSEKGGAPISSNDQSAQLVQHDEMGNFNFDLTKAAGGSSLNPFVVSSSTSGSSNASATASAGTITPTGSSGSGSSTSTVVNPIPRIMAHGILMSLAFLIFFPFGALTMRLLSFPNLVWVHGSIQLFAYVCVVAGAGLGIWYANTYHLLNKTHPVIGLVVFSALFFQPILGVIHHSIYKKSATPKRTVFAHVHIWYGRALLILGAINGGLGLQLANNTTKGEIAYGVVAGVVFLIYIGVTAMASLKGKRAGGTDEKMRGSPRGSPDRTAMMENGR
ncbi:MAG: hypothetical protein MMC33_001370 [Icmadophila ericetorum]|nr:hypothetical protein [Icmadophila ericetorum]